VRNFCCIFFLTCWANNVLAHSFDERYDLPIPLKFFLVGGGLVVVFSFLLILLTSHHWRTFSKSPTNRGMSIAPGLAKCVAAIARFSGLSTFFMVIAAGYWGPGNPLLNLAPNFIWIAWWLGFSITISLFGNFWPICDPWSVLSDIFQRLARTLGAKEVFEKPFFIFPKWLGLYLATVFLLAWSWMEVVYPIAFVPTRVATIALLWTVLNLLGMFLFGKGQWQKRGDIFSLYFSMLGQFGIFTFCKKTSTLKLRLPGEGILLDSNLWQSVSGVAAFIIAMLSIVLFDGLHGSSAWELFVKLIQTLGLIQLSSSDYALGTTGLLFVWLFFVGLFYISCLISSQFTSISASHLTNIFSAALIPIAVAYLFAHNFSSLAIQGQSMIFLASDPLGWGWDLFGTANFHPNIGLIDAGTTWYLAVTSIVLGHVIALLLNHFIAMRIVGSTRMAALITIPQTILMIMFTMLSLVIIAEPMTTSEISFLQQLCITNEVQ